MKILTFMNSLLDRLCMVLGAFIGSQIPAFMQQYTQRLGGHVAELNRLFDHLQVVAGQSNKTINQYIHKFLSSSDPDFVHQGEFMQNLEMRLQQLNQSLYQLTHSSLWDRPFVFIKDLHYDIAQSTFASFQPSLNITVEGLCYTGIGMIAGYAGYQLASRMFGTIYSKFSTHKKERGLQDGAG